MPYTVGDLQRMTVEQLDALFSETESGPIPDGPSVGTALIAPGTDVAHLLAKVALLIWGGKVFDAKDGTLINLLIGGHKAFVATVYYGPSQFDGKECIVLDYSHSSPIVEHIRDEIRRIDAGFYLGKVYWEEKPLTHFCLQFAQ